MKKRSLQLVNEFFEEVFRRAPQPFFNIKGK